MALVTSIIGTISVSKVESALAGQPYLDQATRYAEAIEAGDGTGASDILKELPADAASAIGVAVANAEASSIALSMGTPGVVALLDAVLAFLVIGRRLAGLTT